MIWLYTFAPHHSGSKLSTTQVDPFQYLLQYICQHFWVDVETYYKKIYLKFLWQLLFLLLPLFMKTCSPILDLQCSPELTISGYCKEFHPRFSSFSSNALFSIQGIRPTWTISRRETQINRSNIQTWKAKSQSARRRLVYISGVWDRSACEPSMPIFLILFVQEWARAGRTSSKRAKTQPVVAGAARKSKWGDRYRVPAWFSLMHISRRVKTRHIWKQTWSIVRNLSKRRSTACRLDQGITYAPIDISSLAPV